MTMREPKRSGAYKAEANGNTLQIRHITAKPGTRVHESIKVAELADGAPINLPVIIVRGKEAGPTFLVCSGQHGEEVAGMWAVTRAAAEVNPLYLHGTLIALPAVNVPAYIFRQRLYPLESPAPLDFARITRPTAGGLMTERFAHVVMEEIAPLANFALDIHATHFDSVNYPRTTVNASDDLPSKQRETMLAMARAAGNEIVHRTGRGGLTTNFIEKGIAIIGFEAGEGWRCLEPFPSILVRGIHNVMRHLGMLDGDPEMPEVQVTISKRTEVTVTHGGFSHVTVKPGDYVRPGDRVATVTNWFGDVVEELTAPVEGIIVRVSRLPIAPTGSRVCNIYETHSPEWESRKVPVLEQRIGF
jgi:predicted deacylase